MPEREPDHAPMRQVDDPRLLRAVAHPVRNRILAELSATGPLRAADIATQIDVPANQASFHLRQLAKYGLVEEAPELARDGRDRVWRMVNERGLAVNLDELEDTPGGKAAVSVYRRGVAAQIHALVDSAIGRRQEKGVHVMVSDHALRLTEDEAKEFSRDLTDLAEEWRSRSTGGGEGRRTYRLTMMVQPYDRGDEAG
jgi:DNA-binding transcriptional ArsR family regulator